MKYLHVLAFLGGVLSTCAGVLISIKYCKCAKFFAKLSAGIIGGIIISMVTFDFTPQSISQIGMFRTIIFNILGAIIALVSNKCIDIESKFSRGYLIIVSVFVTNFFQGLAIGSVFLVKEIISIKLILLMMFFNIPKIFVASRDLIDKKMSLKKILICAIITGIPMGVGTMFGTYLAKMFYPLVGCFLAIASGMMMYITVEEIFPKSKSIHYLFGIAIGIILINAFS